MLRQVFAATHLVDPLLYRASLVQRSLRAFEPRASNDVGVTASEDYLLTLFDNFSNELSEA